MNLSAAIETMRYAVELDSFYKISLSLQELVSTMRTLVSSPSDPNVQLDTRAKIDQYSECLQKVFGNLTEADLYRLNELGAEELYSLESFDVFLRRFNENPGMPAVSLEYIARIAQSRDFIIKGFEGVISTAESLAWENDTQLIGDSEVGFTIPRGIFDNNLKGLTKEFDWINRFICLISESVNEDHENIKISRLSTSDPTVYVVATFLVATALGNIVKWALSTWKSVEEIRNLRAQTAKVPIFSQDEIESMFDSKIKQQISNDIEEQVGKLTKKVSDVGRKNELQAGLRILLDQFLQRIERGMTIEIKLIPYESDNDEQETEQNRTAREVLEKLASSLTFPSSSDTPILNLSGGAVGDDKRSSDKPKKAQ